jgi:protein TonB
MFRYLLFLLALCVSAPSIAQNAPQIFQYVEEMPLAPYELNTYIAKHVHYPKKARRRGDEGKVLVKFVVDTDGSITDVRVTKGVSKEIDKEAVRVVSHMPKWKPGKQNGAPVRVYFMLPIIFALED